MLIELIKKIYGRFQYKWKNRKFGYIGKNSRVYKPMRIIGKGNIFIGDDCFFLNGARLETIKHDKGQGVLHIGNNTSFQQSCHVIAADNLIIGSDCVFSARVYVSDCSHPYLPDVDIAKSPLVIKKTEIGNHCFIGIGSCIMPGVHIGNNCVVGANAVVTRDVPDYCMVAGVPARVIKKFDPDLKEWTYLSNFT